MRKLSIIHDTFFLGGIIDEHYDLDVFFFTFAII